MPTTSARRKNSVSVQLAVARRRGIPSAARLRGWASTAARHDLTLRIVGEAEGRRLNKHFRNINRATNVLAFSTGDVVLCHPVIAREAMMQGKTLAAHYAHMVLHGVLHLRGYRHDTKREAARMENAERRILARFGFADPYAVKSPHSR